jgi:hypothetical protein
MTTIRPWANIRDGRIDVLMLSRRKFITAAIGIIAAPAIVRVASLMPVKAWDDPRIAEMGKLQVVEWGEAIPYTGRLIEPDHEEIHRILNKMRSVMLEEIRLFTKFRQFADA